MTAEPLTPEELADLERIYAESEDWRWFHGHAGLQRPLIRRLLATVRTSEDALRAMTWIVERYESEVA